MDPQLHLILEFSRKGKSVACAYPHHFYPTIKDPLTPQVRK